MPIGRDYLLEKPRPPSGSEFFLHTQVVPAAANIAGTLEVWLDRAANRAGVKPSIILAGAIGLISLSLFSRVQRRSAGHDASSAKY